MRKLIDIKEDILIGLKILAAIDNKSLKKFIEAQLEEIVKKSNQDDILIQKFRLEEKNGRPKE